MVSQTVGLVQALELPYATKTVHLPVPLCWLPGHWAAYLWEQFSLGHDREIHPPWPDLLISCGRRSVAIAIAIKHASRGNTFTVHIQNPRVPLKFFDMVIPPEHDMLEGGNVFPTMGALHRLTRASLAQAAESFRKRFASVRRPFVAVLIGGKSRTYDLTTVRMRELSLQLKALVTRHGAGLVVTTSRRTGTVNTAILREVLADTDTIVWDGTGENPYLAMLALADFIIVTEDSASMIAEACFTGKPVYIAGLKGGSRRFDFMHQRFREAGFTRIFNGDLETWAYEPLDENKRIASIVRERMKIFNTRTTQLQEGSA